MFRRRVFIGQLAVAVAEVGLLAAQQRPTRLVEVSVTVVDKKGNGVAGLGPADFVVRDEGKSRPVDVFRFDGASGGSGAESPAVAPPGVFTNLPAYSDTAPRSVTALVLDNITMTPTEGVKARALMMRYLTALAPRALTGVYLMAGSDTQAPMEAMASVTGRRYFFPGDTTGPAKILGDM
jgi:hypothetical protein